MSRLTLPADQATEDQLITQIRSLTDRLHETLRQLSDAKAELEIRRQIAVGSIPGWMRPTKNLSIAQVVLNALHHNAPRGVTFDQLVGELQRAGREVKRPSLTAILGRLKREQRIIRRDGRWRLAPYEFSEPAPEKEYEKEDW